MKIRFIAHSGYQVFADGHEILFDPWIFDSTLHRPLINGLVPPNRTIDFLIPQPVHKISDFSPKVIFLSHFHTHHSPFLEIEALLKNTNSKIKIVCPQIGEKKLEIMQKVLGENFDKIEFDWAERDKQGSIGPLTWRSINQTFPNHFIYILEDGKNTFLHMADSGFQTGEGIRKLPSEFIKIREHNVTYAAVSTGGHAIAMTSKSGEKYINNQAFSPIETAQWVSQFQPRAVSVMGFFNFSHWKNRTEWVLPSDVIEDQFTWALRHLSPQITVVPMRPGIEINLKNHQLENLTFFNPY